MYRSGAVMAWNVFKFCTALRGLGSIMILLVLGVVGVTYYAVVLCNYGPALAAGGLDSLIALVILIVFHTLLVMLLWSYFSVVFTDPGGVPPNYRPLVDQERGDIDPLEATEFGPLATPDPTNARIRYCRKWEVCAENGSSLCVGCKLCWGTKLQFYTFLETTVVTLALLPHFIAFFSDGEIPGSPSTLATTFLAFVLNLAFALSVLGFLIMHISLVSANTTTIEVFGTVQRYWFIPAYCDEDLRKMPALQGIEYPSKPDLDAQEF
ncbi:Zinc finger, DHHC-type, palmitoyltransferase [Cynara cardunculus var. scolymus]|uniref:Zinc finger, DHHC-type, palmitoyltransferase n=1 Tax=Cynara cardunculus var. scolymus TaxID=59895 RepID=A0A103XEG6_CYNCS|nr:Zinc finger, DHHC-type, palmitoyltransferase [Cynara cardunculus var. scolymus]